MENIKPHEDNPLQNMKLKKLNKNLHSPEFVLTFRNRSCKQYTPKQEVKYRKLMKNVNEEHLKRDIIIQELSTCKKMNNRR